MRDRRYVPRYTLWPQHTAVRVVISFRFCSCFCFQFTPVSIVSLRSLCLSRLWARLFLPSLPIDSLSVREFVCQTLSDLSLCPPKAFCSAAWFHYYESFLLRNTSGSLKIQGTDTWYPLKFFVTLHSFCTSLLSTAWVSCCFLLCCFFFFHLTWRVNRVCVSFCPAEWNSDWDSGK